MPSIITGVMELQRNAVLHHVDIVILVVGLMRTRASGLLFCHLTDMRYIGYVRWYLVALRCEGSLNDHKTICF